MFLPQGGPSSGGFGQETDVHGADVLYRSGELLW